MSSPDSREGTDYLRVGSASLVYALPIPAQPLRVLFTPRPMTLISYSLLSISQCLTFLLLIFTISRFSHSFFLPFSLPKFSHTSPHLRAFPMAASEQKPRFPNRDEIRKDTTHLIVYRGRTKFNITVHHALIADTDFYKKYEQDTLRHYDYLQRRIDGVPVDEPHRPPERLIETLLLPVSSRLAPNPSIRGLTIGDLVVAPTYALELVAGEAGHEDVHFIGEGNVTFGPNYHISPLPSQDLPPSCRGTDIPLIDASLVRISPTPENADGRRVHTPQGKVFISDGTARYFKPRRVPVDFARELEILGHLRGLRGGEVRTSYMTEIVTSGATVVGLLLEMIPGGYPIMDKRAWEDPAACEKWEAQVRKTVEVLHTNDLVWGDVNPGNVVVDEDGDAHIIDFGGFFNEAFVPEQLRETKEGDWHGIRRLFEDWLPTRRKDVHLSAGCF